MFMVMPSRFEASPLVVAEAFCYRLPVVLFDIAELRDLPDACTRKVQAFSTEGLGRVMMELSLDANARRAMGEAAKHYVQGLSWDGLAERYEKFLDDVARHP
jgi:glycosyltransferase involved in cell wall biosynthesis